MKKPETTAAFVMICIVALVAAYGLGDCIKEIKASRIQAAQNKILKIEIKQIQSYSSGNENNFAQNRNTRTGTGIGTQDFGQRNNMMGQGRQLNGSPDNQNMNTRGMNMFGGSSTDTQKKVEEPNNSNKQGGY